MSAFAALGGEGNMPPEPPPWIRPGRERKEGGGGERDERKQMKP